jgi:hypothetical protein
MMRFGGGYVMAQSGNLSDKEKLKIVKEELEMFQNAVKGHEKLLKAIAEM